MPRSYHVVLPHELAGLESGRAQRTDVERGLAVDDELGDKLARRRRVHDAVPRKSRRVDEAVDPVDFPEYWMLVGRVLIEAGPSCLYRGSFEDRKPPERALDDRGHEVGIHAVVEPGLLVRIGHAEKYAPGFSMRVET